MCSASHDGAVAPLVAELKGSSTVRGAAALLVAEAR